MQSVMSAPLSAVRRFVTEGDQDEWGRVEEVGRLVDLAQVWALITDPRDARGRRHSLVAILSLVQAAVVAGATTLAAAGHWIAAAPQHVLAEAGAWWNRRTGRYVAPHPDTVADVLSRLNMAEVDAAYARHQSARMSQMYDQGQDGSGGELIALAVDGKTQRGSAHTGRRAGHRLGAHLAEDGITLAQIDVAGKSNEIAAFIPLLDHIDNLRNVVVLADRMHTQRQHATYLHDRGAYYLLPVGRNQPTLFDQLDAMDWKNVPIGWTTNDRGHGRQETRTIQVAPTPHTLTFPHTAQVFLLERHIHDLTGTPLRTEAILGITSLPPTKATPQRLAELIRAEWSIENRDHHIRDVTFGEDRCRARTGTLPSILAVMRSHAITALRLLGFTNIAEATRWARDDFTHPLIALGLT